MADDSKTETQSMLDEWKRVGADAIALLHMSNNPDLDIPIQSNSDVSGILISIEEDGAFCARALGHRALGDDEEDDDDYNIPIPTRATIQIKNNAIQYLGVDEQEISPDKLQQHVHAPLFALMLNAIEQRTTQNAYSEPHYIKEEYHALFRKHRTPGINGQPPLAELIKSDETLAMVAEYKKQKATVREQVEKESEQRRQDREFLLQRLRPEGDRRQPTKEPAAPQPPSTRTRNIGLGLAALATIACAAGAAIDPEMTFLREFLVEGTRAFTGNLFLGTAIAAAVVTMGSMILIMSFHFEDKQRKDTLTLFGMGMLFLAGITTFVGLCCMAAGMNSPEVLYTTTIPVAASLCLWMAIAIRGKYSSDDIEPPKGGAADAAEPASTTSSSSRLGPEQQTTYQPANAHTPPVSGYVDSSSGQPAKTLTFQADAMD